CPMSEATARLRSGSPPALRFHPRVAAPAQSMALQLCAGFDCAEQAESRRKMPPQDRSLLPCFFVLPRAPVVAPRRLFWSLVWAPRRPAVSSSQRASPWTLASVSFCGVRFSSALQDRLQHRAPPCSRCPHWLPLAGKHDQLRRPQQKLPARSSPSRRLRSPRVP